MQCHFHIRHGGEAGHAVEQAVAGPDQPARQQADAQALLHSGFQAGQAGAHIGQAPAPACGIQRMRHLAAVQAALRKYHQGQGIHPVAGMPRTVYPGQRFRPARHAGRAAAALLDDGQVQLAGLELLPYRLRQPAGQLQAQLRLAARQRAQGGHQGIAGKVLWYADAQHGFGGASQLLHGLVHEREDALRIGQQALSFQRAFHMAPAAVQQRAAHLLLQPADLLADRGLGQVHALRRAREAAGFGHGAEAAQQGGVYGRGLHGAWANFSGFVTAWHLII
ncbi:hypothetical protein GY14_12720 [Delftia tsuruhatensis]|nr:hypothetical protein GY14_12720 [Delftia tsuruhatensis]